MTKTDDALEELEESTPDYLKKVGNFVYENKSYTLIDHYNSDTFKTCQICSKEEIKEIYVVQDSEGRLLNVGNVCIINITGDTSEKIKHRFIDYSDRKKNIEKNRNAIDTLSIILEKYDDEELPIWISKQGIKRLQTLYDRLYAGDNYTNSQRKLYNYYIKKMKRAASE